MKKNSILYLGERVYYKIIFYTFLAEAEGFEPSNDGVRVHCLTTWRRPTI